MRYGVFDLRCVFEWFLVGLGFMGWLGCRWIVAVCLLVCGVGKLVSWFVRLRFCVYWLCGCY